MHGAIVAGIGGALAVMVQGITHEGGPGARQGNVAAEATAEPSGQDLTPAELGLDYINSAMRISIPVEVGEAGPFPFVIDTGAERTVISRQLANRLALGAGRPVMMTSMVDRSSVATAMLPELAIGGLPGRRAVEAPMLDRAHLGSDGMIGIDALRDRKLLIDFDAGRIAVSESAVRDVPRPKYDEVLVQARSRFGQLIITTAYIGRHRIQVVIDTGAQVSIGNAALMRLISRDERKALQQTSIVGVTGAVAPAQYTTVKGIRIDGIQFGRLPVAFANVEPFRYFELNDKPALLLGLAALKSFRRVEVDFPNRQIRFRVPPADPVRQRLNTGSMLRGVRGSSPGRTY